MAFGNQLGPTVLNHVEAWVPKKAYRRETRFRDDLMDYLEEQLNSGGGMWGQSQSYSVRKERGKSNADIAVNDTVGIELKREITNNLDRLAGQIPRYTSEYEFVIVCACGVKETGRWNELRQEHEGQTGMGFGQSATVRFVEKHKDGRTFRDDRGTGGGLFGGSLF